jgi:hypothetical protein
MSDFFRLMIVRFHGAKSQFGLMGGGKGQEDGVVLVEGEGLFVAVVGDGEEAGFGGGSAGGLVEGGYLRGA